MCMGTVELMNGREVVICYIILGCDVLRLWVVYIYIYPRQYGLIVLLKITPISGLFSDLG